MVLTECVFEVSEYKVVRAVKSWTERSIWVQKAYNSAPMPKDQVHLIMQHTDPFCLTIEQFDELTFFNQPERSIFNRYTVDLVRTWFCDAQAMYIAVQFIWPWDEICQIHDQFIGCSSGRLCLYIMGHALIHQSDALTVLVSLKSLRDRLTPDESIPDIAGQVLVATGPCSTARYQLMLDHGPIICIRRMPSASPGHVLHGRGQV